MTPLYQRWLQTQAELTTRITDALEDYTKFHAIGYEAWAKEERAKMRKAYRRCIQQAKCKKGDYHA